MSYYGTWSLWRTPSQWYKRGACTLGNREQGGRGEFGILGTQVKTQQLQCSFSFFLMFTRLPLWLSRLLFADCCCSVPVTAAMVLLCCWLLCWFYTIILLFHWPRWVLPSCCLDCSNLYFGQFFLPPPSRACEKRTKWLLGFFDWSEN